MPFFSSAVNRPSTRPGPPPQASSARPPQNTNLPSCLKAWREYIGAKRMPFRAHPQQRLLALRDQQLGHVRGCCGSRSAARDRRNTCPACRCRNPRSPAPARRGRRVSADHRRRYRQSAARLPCSASCRRARRTAPLRARAPAPRSRAPPAPRTSRHSPPRPRRHRIRPRSPSSVPPFWPIGTRFRCARPTARGEIGQASEPPEQRNHACRSHRSNAAKWCIR